MKSYKHLFEKIVEHDNLLEAIREASLGKRDRPYIRKYLDNPEPYIEKLRAGLIDRTYKIPHHVPKIINDGIQHKKRAIITPDFTEQIIHHALIQVLRPIIEHGMYEYTCGSIPLRGASYGREYIRRYIKRHPNDVKYCLKMDVHHFFQSIDHDVIKGMFRRIIKDDDTLWLLDLIIDSYTDSGTGQGLPIGYYTSQWFSNWFLQGLDHYIKEEGAGCYVRYMDDMVVFGPNKRKLHELRRKISAYLGDLGLELKSDWQVFRFDYGGKYRFLDFMGFRFYRDRVTLRRSIYYRVVRKAARLRKRQRYNWFVACQMISYLGYIRGVDCYNVWLNRIKGKIYPKYLKRILSAHQRRINDDRLDKSGGELLPVGV